MSATTTETIKYACGIIATVISVISFFPYLRDVFRRKTQPHSYTWLIWTILQVTGVVAMFNNGAGIGALALTVGAFFCGYIFILSLKYGTKNITLFDTVCLIGALAAIAVYVFLHNPVLSVILITVIDFVGFLPTLRKAYVEPYSETISLYALGVIWSTFNIIAISTYSLTTTLYPSCILFANAVCCLVLWAKRK
jgi:uncharacterized membrane protein HdeD (DUF308 family)